MRESESLVLPITPYPKGARWIRHCSGRAPRERYYLPRSPTARAHRAQRSALRPTAARRLSYSGGRASRLRRRQASRPASAARPATQQLQRLVQRRRDRPPVTATRTGVKATFGLSPRSSISAAFSAGSSEAASKSGRPSTAVMAASSTGLTPASSTFAAAAGSTANCSSGMNRNRPSPRPRTTARTAPAPAAPPPGRAPAASHQAPG